MAWSAKDPDGRARPRCTTATTTCDTSAWKPSGNNVSHNVSGARRVAAPVPRSGQRSTWRGTGLWDRRKWPRTAHGTEMKSIGNSWHEDLIGITNSRLEEDLQLVRKSNPKRRERVEMNTDQFSVKAWVREEVCTDIDKENDFHEDVSTTKIIKKTLFSLPHDGVVKQRSAELCHEGQGGRRVREHEGLRLCEFDPVEGGACIHGDQRRRDRKVISPLHQRVVVDCIRKLEGPHDIASLIGSSTSSTGAQRRQYTHQHCTYSAVQSFHKRGTHRTRLTQELHNIFVRLRRVCHLVWFMTHPCWLLPRLSFTTSTSSSSFTLASTTTPEHAQQSGQYDLLQEHPVHHQPLQEQQVQKHRYQEPPCRENQQSGGNPRNTLSIGYEPKELATVSKITKPHQLHDAQKEFGGQEHQAPIHEEVNLEKLGHTAYWISKAMIVKYQGRATFNRTCTSTIPQKVLQILISKMVSDKRCWLHHCMPR